uniref:hypothetical protein n=1 Tax=Pseudomonas fluorescens TaxID=294 RepID=UPI0018674C66|nr:hypothetical protein [Pseudomonas fluorescens]
MAITDRDTVERTLRSALLNPEQRSRALAFRQLRLREELSGVGVGSEPLPELNRYLAGELTLGELVDLRLRPELCE